MNKRPVLKIMNLESWYGELKILHGINMEVNQGELVAIIGPNGSGKSTTMKCIAGVIQKKNGKIFLDSKFISRKQPHDITRIGISYVPQGRQVFPHLTVRENLEMGAYIMADHALIKTSLDAVFKKFPFLESKQDDYAYTLSGGQQQMLAIARALMQNPEVLLLDEPSLGLSPKMMKEVFQKIKEINKEGVAIVLVEQNAKQATEIADRTYILEDGKIMLKGGKKILKDKRVKRIYLGGR